MKGKVWPTVPLTQNWSSQLFPWLSCVLCQVSYLVWEYSTSAHLVLEVRAKDTSHSFWSPYMPRKTKALLGEGAGTWHVFKNRGNRVGSHIFLGRQSSHTCDVTKCSCQWNRKGPQHSTVEEKARMGLHVRRRYRKQGIKRWTLKQKESKKK